MEKDKIHPTTESSGSSATTVMETTLPETALNLTSLTAIETTSNTTRTQPIAVPQGLPMPTVDVVLEAEALAMNRAATGEMLSHDPGAALHHLMAMTP